MWCSWASQWASWGEEILVTDVKLEPVGLLFLGLPVWSSQSALIVVKPVEETKKRLKGRGEEMSYQLLIENNFALTCWKICCTESLKQSKRVVHSGMLYLQLVSSTSGRTYYEEEKYAWISNHRMVWLGREGLQGHLVWIPCCRQGLFPLDQLAKAPFRLVLNASRDEAFTIEWPEVVNVQLCFRHGHGSPLW